MKKFVRYFMLLLILPIAFVVTGCVGKDGAVSIKKIEKTSTVGLVDTYTITYTNGETEQFTITNGEDGENIYTNITINDLFQTVKNSGTKPSGYTIVDFVNEYLNIQVDAMSIASATALRSAVSIYVEHEIDIVDYTNPTGYNPIMGYNYGVKRSIAWGAGSGVIYDLDKSNGNAYIITNYHVCYSKDSKSTDGIAKRFTLYLYGGESLMSDLNALGKYNSDNSNAQYSSKFEFDQNGLPIINYGYGAISAEYVGGSEKYDIAVLKVTNSEVLKNSDSLEAEVVDSDLVSVGSTAIAVGNPGAGGIAVTKGIVSIDSTFTKVEISDANNPAVLREFRIDTPVNGGNSGGGLYDSYGRLIGIVNAKFMSTVYDDVNYAIPTNVAVRIAEIIIDTCDGVDRVPNRILVGFTIKTINSKSYYNQDDGVMRINETVQVVVVNDDSLADVIGLEVGDILTSVEIIKNDDTIKVDIQRRHQVIDVLLYAREGDCVKFNYTRGGVAGSVTTAPLVAESFIEIA
ncbi:MAG: S1C family serine protease [Clostridia bacterium]